MKLYEEGPLREEGKGRFGLGQRVAVISSFPVGDGDGCGETKGGDDVHGERGRERKEIANGEPGICASAPDAASSSSSLPPPSHGPSRAVVDGRGKLRLSLVEGGAHCVFPRTLRLSVDLSR